jgi:hypothetical protein
MTPGISRLYAGGHAGKVNLSGSRGEPTSLARRERQVSPAPTNCFSAKQFTGRNETIGRRKKPFFWSREIAPKRLLGNNDSG